MRPLKDNTFCWYPFSLLALKEWHGERGIINASPCCNSIRPETPDPLGVKDLLHDNPEKLMPSDIFYGEQMESIRQAMREGRRHSACNTCWKIEDSGAHTSSYRLQSSPPGRLKVFEESQVLVDNPKLQSIDFAFGENCNLRCRMCMPGLSNKLRIDYQHFVENNIDTSGIHGFDYKRYWDRYGKKWDQNINKGSDTEVYNWKQGSQWQNILDNIHDLRHIKATGGETLLSKPFIEFLDTAIQQGVAKNIYLEFHTNATKFTNANIERLKQFDGLHINCSIDSIGKNYEYIRYPMLWSKLDNNLHNFLEKTKDAPSMRDSWKVQNGTADPLIKCISFNVVLSALNAHYIPDLFAYHKHLTGPHTHIEGKVFYIDLLWPENKFTNVKYLPPKIKKNILDKYHSMTVNNPHWAIMTEVAISFLKSWLDYNPTEQDRLNMLREITVFDLSRKQSYKDYLHPELIEFLETPIA